MENIITYNELQKCPYHSQHKHANQYNSDREDANTGDWDDERDDARTDKEGYNTDKNDNTGGSGSSGSAATNS
ncbi:hypothetical protein [Flavobacterium sp. N1736]|uniref:hypothetical protein n=1 Tax=Flavobacterium sp. N1736 TaxID=2986823 RepID=UPI0022240A35|nr:hypothetical protein [Flavobacterium sp. N1736]